MVTLPNSFITPSSIERIPQYLKSDYPQFVKFLEYYYTWLDENLFHSIDTIDNIFDIDVSDNVNALYDVYLNDIPKNIVVSKRLFAKLIRDFYKSKGTEDSVRFLIKALYNQDATFYYPKVDILRASDGKWVKRKSIRVSYSTKYLDIANTKIIGETTLATGTVEYAVSYYIGAFQVIEIFLSESIGNFVSNERIALHIDEPFIGADIVTYKNITYYIPDNSVTTYGILQSVNILNAGTGYIVGDSITVNNGITGIEAACKVKSITKGRIESVNIVYGGSGYSVGDQVVFSSVIGANTALAKVQTVSSGEITSIEMLSKGFGYRSLPTITVTSAGAGANLTAVGPLVGGIKEVELTTFGINYNNIPTLDCTAIGNGNATLTAVLGANCNYTGLYKNTDGFLSWDKRLQDSYYYQDFSYVIKSGASISSYRDLLKRLVHPAGMIFFGAIDSDIDLYNDVMLNLDVNLGIGWEFTVDLSTPFNWLPLKDEVPSAPENFFSLGPTFEDFDNGKFWLQSSRSAIYHYYDIELNNFVSDLEKVKAFNFVPDAEIEIV